MMRLIDADELMNDMLHITTIDGKIPLKVVIAAIWEAPTLGGFISEKDKLPEDSAETFVWHTDVEDVNDEH